jgi:glutamate--cysteine ligase
MRFIEAFLIYCLLDESPPFDAASYEETLQNQSLTAKRGREPGLALQRDGKPVGLLDWAGEIVEKVAAVAELIDHHEDDGSYRDATTFVASQVAEPDSTPSARLLQELHDSDCSFFEVAEPDSTPSARLLQELHDSDCSFFEFALDAARRHKAYFSSIAPMPPQRAQQIAREARESVQRQRDIEAADEISFEEYLARYFASD